MKRKIIQDVIPPKEIKGIRSIPVPLRTPRESFFDSGKQIERAHNTNNEISAQSKDKFSIKASSDDSKPIIPASNGGEGFGFKKILFFFLFLAGVGAIYLLYLFFNAGATVTIEPKQRSVVINKSFMAKKNPQENELGFEVINLNETQKKSVSTTGEKKVEKRARGKVVIYNDYNSQPQRLIKNTRLLTPDGLIYRIESSIVVPGQTKKGNVVTPGSIEIEVAADEAGEKYNIDLTDFTIPGFKGDPRYEKFYGRSKVPMTGGFEGTIKTASALDIELARKELMITLKDKLTNRIKEQVPNSFILYDKAIYISFESISSDESSEVEIKAVVNAVVISKEQMARNLAKEYIDDYRDENITSNYFDKLAIEPDPKEGSPWQTGVFPFALSGATTLTYVIDSEKLKEDLLGIPKNLVNDIYKNYSGIEKAETSLIPKWKSALPEDRGKIKINILGAI